MNYIFVQPADAYCLAFASLKHLSALHCLGPSRLVILVTQHYNGSFYEPNSILTGDPIGLTPSIAKSYADPQYPQKPSTSLNLLLKH